MHKTKTGRWQPDTPVAPQPEAEPLTVHDLSYESYLTHRYTHRTSHYDCHWCTGCLVCLSADQTGGPFAVLDTLMLWERGRA